MPLDVVIGQLSCFKKSLENKEKMPKGSCEEAAYNKQIIKDLNKELVL